MGSTNRARILSDRFNNDTLKAIALYVFDKCGNCIYRVNCAGRILSSGGTAQPFEYILVKMVDNCPTETFKHTGKVSGEMATFFRGTCGKCDKLNLCAGYLSEAGGRASVEEKRVVHNKLLKCTQCDRLEDCIQHMMKEMKLGKFRLMKEAIAMVFRRCSKQNMQKVFIELDDTENADINVEGSILKR